MKILIMLMLLIFPFSGICGEIVTTPQDIVISEPVTDKVMKLRMSFFYNQLGEHVGIVWYNIMNQAGTEVVRSESVTIRNIEDDPATITADCVGPGDPHSLCTGVGTCTNDCDESTTDFTDYLEGIAATLNSRTEAIIWQDIQSKYPTQ